MLEGHKIIHLTALELQKSPYIHVTSGRGVDHTLSDVLEQKQGGKGRTKKSGERGESGPGQMTAFSKVMLSATLRLQIVIWSLRG